MLLCFAVLCYVCYVVAIDDDEFVSRKSGPVSFPLQIASGRLNIEVDMIFQAVHGLGENNMILAKAGELTRRDRLTELNV